MKDQVQWTAPSPLWPEAAASQNAAVRRALRRPAVLRFASDTFMDDFLALMEHEPARLDEYLAAPETWRAPASSPDPVERAPEFVKKLSNFRLAARRTLDRATGLAPAKVLSPASPAAKLSVGAKASGASLVAANTLALSTAVTAQKPLKLFQPAHQRFYLVAGCLVCRVPGLPDKALDTAREERVSYVVRRMYQRHDGEGEPVGPVEEYGFVVTPRGSGWQKVSGALALVENEERLPLFGVNFTERDGRRRRLFAGMIPVGRRETYMGAGTYTPTTNGTSAPNSTSKTARKIHFRMLVTEPWKNILRVADDARNTLNAPVDEDFPQPSDEDKATLKRDSRASAQVTSWLVLLDFAKFLKQYAPAVWTAVTAGNKNNLAADSPQAKLYDALEDMEIEPSDPLVGALQEGTQYTDEQVASSMRDALARIGEADPDDPTKLRWESVLDNVETPYNRETSPIDAAWPDFLYPLADLEHDVPLPPEDIGPPPAGDAADEAEEQPDVTEPLDLAEKQTLVDKLAALVARALPAESSEPVADVPLAARPVLDTREGTFLVRFVYERPFCGPLDPPVLSEPSTEFQLAGFFDPDAPARPIRIALPLDVSPAGLRKFDKNTAFMISDQLCGQMNRLKGITFADLVLSVLPWPFHKDLSVRAPEIGPCKDNAGLSLGMICTLSIPIITICALILLFIIVLLLDFIFRWMPFFIMCFPLPGFKAKRS